MSTLGLTGHNLEAIEALALEIGNNFVSLLLLLGTPTLDVMQNVNSGRTLGFDGEVLLFTEYGLVHCLEIDDGDR